jgi:hypothetical protein
MAASILSRRTLTTSRYFCIEKDWPAAFASVSTKVADAARTRGAGQHAVGYRRTDSALALADTIGSMSPFTTDGADRPAAFPLGDGLSPV